MRDHVGGKICQSLGALGMVIPVGPFTVSFFGEGSPTKIEYRKKRVPLFQPPLEDLVLEVDIS